MVRQKCKNLNMQTHRDFHGQHSTILLSRFTEVLIFTGSQTINRYQIVFKFKLCYTSLCTREENSFQRIQKLEISFMVRSHGLPKKKGPRTLFSSCWRIFWWMSINEMELLNFIKKQNRKYCQHWESMWFCN